MKASCYIKMKNLQNSLEETRGQLEFSRQEQRKAEANFRKADDEAIAYKGNTTSPRIIKDLPNISFSEITHLEFLDGKIAPY